MNIDIKILPEFRRREKVQAEIHSALKASRALSPGRAIFIWENENTRTGSQSYGFNFDKVRAHRLGRITDGHSGNPRETGYLCRAVARITERHPVKRSRKKK